MSAPTVVRYLDLLVATFVVRRLRPWHANIKKRQVKSPKIYIHDTGLLHALLNMSQRLDLERHPKVGASWESFAMNELVARLGARWDECSFWATHQGVELDLLEVRGRQRLGFELRRSSAPRLTPSMRIAARDLSLTRLTVFHAGTECYPLGRTIRAVPLSRLHDEVATLR